MLNDVLYHNLNVHDHTGDADASLGPVPQQSHASSAAWAADQGHPSPEDLESRPQVVSASTSNQSGGRASTGNTQSLDTLPLHWQLPELRRVEAHEV
ncbi:MAG: hypothetical protein ACOC0P_06145, partial [Planctomycetota bacterium]